MRLKFGPRSFPILPAALLAAQLAFAGADYKRFPYLAFVVRDPDAFVMDMEKRFERQKLLTPNDPHQFDYSEIGIPVLKSMEQGLTEKISEFSDKLVRRERGYKPQELQTAILYMKSLLGEVQGHLAKNQVSYRDSVELSTYYSRITEGYRPLTIAEEYKIYQKRAFTLFQPGAGHGAAGFKQSEAPYVAAFLNKNELGTIVVPTAEPLNCDILMRLMSREKINLIGATAEPIQADGFLRTSGYSWYHDLRHESAKVFEKERYIKTNHVPREKMHELDHQMDKWFVEMESEISKIPDPDVRAAVEFMTFNLYHDRGFPIVPSAYNRDTGNSAHYFTALGLVVGKEGLSFRKPIRSLRAAEKWVTAFWAPRREEERKFLASLRGGQ